ncbi:MAG: hypothetical protein ACK5Y2_11210 [Bdellovibrionales bacterium]
MSSIELMQRLAIMGAVYPLNIAFDVDLVHKGLEPFSKSWKPYNPRKVNYGRWGLSLTSLDGQLTGVPDLDSLLEYNAQSGTHYQELDFRMKTSVYKEVTELSQLSELSDYLCRSHFIKLTRGGFFPPHRDSRPSSMNTFRLFSLLSHVDRRSFQFILDGRIVDFTPGRLYFINTLLEHSLVSFAENCTCLVLNVELCSPAVAFVEKSLLIV